MLADRFCAFFAAANGGHEPYPWQSRLVAQVARSGHWPSAICAPTGSGKSSVVDVHVFLVAERARQRAVPGAELIARPPRRLVLVAPRRVLVDDQFERATALAALIAEADDAPLAEVRTALASLVTAAGDGGSPLKVTRLRGGAALDVSWRLDPSACQVICATPQMWGSRLLLRGFRGSARARNLESGLLSADAAVIVDEAHLHERLVDTAARVVALGDGDHQLQLVAMSATRAADGHGLDTVDLEDRSLAQRVTAAKTVVVEEVAGWHADGPRRLAEHAMAARAARPDDGTVGVFANTVARALAVVEALAAAGHERMRLVCGRMRPVDLERLRAEHPGLLAPQGNPDVDYLVSTQSLEVGVDLDLGTIVSDLAPAAALAQRLGRLNRTGHREASCFQVVAPAAIEGDDEASFGPYTAGEARAAREWLETLGSDASPQRVASVGLPEPFAIPVPSITSAELRVLAMTGHQLVADVDPAFYVEDPCEAQIREVQVCARAHLGLDEPVVRAWLSAVPPMAHELASLSLPPGKPAGRTVLEKVLAAAPNPWVVRHEEGRMSAEPLVAERGELPLRAGDIIVIDAGTRVMAAGVIGAPGAKAARIDDVSGVRAADGPDPPPVVLAIPPDRAAVVAEIAAADPVLATRRSRGALADNVAELDAGLARRLRGHRYLADLSVTWAWDGDPEAPGLLMVTETPRGGADIDLSVPEEPVLVDEHCAAVATRMRRIVDALDGVADGHRTALEQAALLHDEGKRHPRFQRRMGAQEGDPALAKPRPGHVPDRGDGWRHEQLSAADAWSRTSDALTTTLVAAHHGTGRPLFDRGAAALLDGWDPGDGVAEAAAALFGPAGTYETDRAALEERLGVHGLAYLEALVRCADAQVSREGGS